MEAVAPDAVVPVGAGEREPLGELGHAPVERGVEAGDLGQAGEALGDDLDAAQLGGEVERGEGDQLAQGRHERRVDARRGLVVGSPEDDPVADGGRGGQAEPLERGEHRAQRRLMVAERGRLDVLAPTAVGGPDRQPAFPLADALDHPAGEACLRTACLRRIPALEPVQAAPQRRGAGVQAQDDDRRVPPGLGRHLLVQRQSRISGRSSRCSTT